MSFNRRMYDDCSTSIKLTQSKSPGNYMLYDGKFYNQNQCRIPKGIVSGNEVSLSKRNLVDLESDLRGQTRPLSDCFGDKYQPSGSEKLIHQKECSMFNYNETALPDGIPQYKCNYPY